MIMRGSIEWRSLRRYIVPSSSLTDFTPCFLKLSNKTARNSSLRSLSCASTVSRACSSVATVCRLSTFCCLLFFKIPILNVGNFADNEIVVFFRELQSRDGIARLRIALRCLQFHQRLFGEELPD